LVLDDIGTEFNDGKGMFAAKLDRLLDARYREYRRTLITTNLTGAALAERYDSRVIDRIREGAVWQTITGESMRRSHG
jgi:DNA replication protein DnaC